MGRSPIEEDPGDAGAEEGNIILDGPDGVAVTMSPDAAEETGRRLLEAAEEARKQVPGTETPLP